MQNNHLFTKPEAWSGGFIEAAILLKGSQKDIPQAIEQMWKCTELAGPYSRQNVEPELQSITKPPLNELEYTMQFGVFTLPNQMRFPLLLDCFVDKDGLWISANVPVGSLPPSWSLGGYPFVGDPSFKLEPLFNSLKKLVNQLANHMSVCGSIVGWLTLLEYEELVAIVNNQQSIPEQRWHAYHLFHPQKLYLPPNMSTPLIQT